MGKYMRKSKLTGEVAVMELVSSSSQSTIGVRTRARTLALQRTLNSDDSSSYLELRSRRLEKPPLAKPKHNQTTTSDHPTSVPTSNKEEGSVDVEVSFGENVLDFDSRSVRETTPCSLIRNSETLVTPGSTTRRTSSTGTNRRMQGSMHRNIPTTKEMEEFFSGAERLQQRTFTEKYNFDPVNDCPLPGRYEWLKLN